MNDSLIIAIDLLWLKHKKIGGVESYIRNILDGLMEIENQFEIKLIVARDNADSFQKYNKDSRFEIIKCNVNSMDVAKRIIWQNLHLGKLLKKLKIDVCFEPHNYIPTFGIKNIKFITTIHDLQLAHYPEFFSKKKVIWFKYNWKHTLLRSRAIVAISNSVKNDIIHYYPGYDDKIDVIYNSICINKIECKNIDEIKNKYGVDYEQFYYTVSSLHPHKNLLTLLKVFEIIKKDKLDLPCKLLISGIGGTMKDQLMTELENRELKEVVQLTGFVDDEIRNALYKNCKAFLFPSIFEGFGMPPIEALMFDTPVITTRKSCLEEVTQGKANYVDDPFDPNEWINKMYNCSYEPIDFNIYDKNYIARKYYDLFLKVFNS